MSHRRVLQIVKVFLRLALGITFLVAIGDRFGWLGPYGSKNVSWGDWTHFVQYVGVLNSFVPKSLIPGLAVLETIIELGLGIALLLGIYQRLVAWGSAALLMSFAVTMSLALGITAPLSYSVFTALGAPLLLGAVAVSDAARSSVGLLTAAESMTNCGSDTLPARQQAGAAGN
jgi:putative oxidoreductase